MGLTFRGDMENTETVETPVTPDTVEPQAVPVPEFVYSYQPMDDFSRPLGAAQVFKGKDAQEVLGKVAEAHRNSVKLNRELNRKLRLGITESEEVPAETTKFNQVQEFLARQLTPDERITISRDLLDPDRFEEASNLLFESAIGAKPETIRQTLNKVQETNNQLLAKVEADAFVQANPIYYKCKENFETITGWMVKNNLAPIRENFQLAYDRLMTAGLLFEAPIAREVVPVTKEEPITPVEAQPEQAEPSRITSVEPAIKKPVTKISTGLTNKQSSTVGNSPKTGLTLADINKMTASEFKRRLISDKSFGSLVEKLENEAAKKKEGG